MSTHNAIMQKDATSTTVLRPQIHINDHDLNY